MGRIEAQIWSDPVRLNPNSFRPKRPAGPAAWSKASGTGRSDDPTVAIDLLRHFLRGILSSCCQRQASVASSKASTVRSNDPTVVINLPRRFLESSVFFRPQRGFQENNGERRSSALLSSLLDRRLALREQERLRCDPEDVFSGWVSLKSSRCSLRQTLTSFFL